MASEPDPCVLVIFGASGDLTARKIIPALYDLSVCREPAMGLPQSMCVLGVSRTVKSDDDWREELADGACSEDERTIGTYLHGLLDSDAFRHAFLRAARAARQHPELIEAVPVS